MKGNMMETMSNARKAALAFKQALKHDDAGNHDKADAWLEKACLAENKAVNAGEAPVDI